LPAVAVPITITHTITNIMGCCDYSTAAADDPAVDDPAALLWVSPATSSAIPRSSPYHYNLHPDCAFPTSIETLHCPFFSDLSYYCLNPSPILP
jgi:hypothetical protein